MSASFSESDQTMADLVAAQASAGDIEAAKRTASHITTYPYQRQAWLSILYRQFHDLNLQGVKETILSLPDGNLWLGTWVHDLILLTARSGDIEGAKTFVKKLPEDAPRGPFTMIIVGVQAQRGDYHGAESTLATMLPANPWHDLSLLVIAREMLTRGDVDQAEAITERIVDAETKANAVKLCAAPASTPHITHEPKTQTDS